MNPNLIKVEYKNTIVYVKTWLHLVQVLENLSLEKGDNKITLTIAIGEQL